MTILLSVNEFDEIRYMEGNDEVVASIERNECSSPYEHFILNISRNDHINYKKISDIQSVTIVIPIYNAEQFLEFTLESVISQKYPYWECILVNDFSTDNSLKIIKKYIARDKRFKLLEHRANGGLSAARNSGMRAAHGEFICFLDSDDLLMEDSIGNRVSALKESDNPRLMGSYSGSQTIAEDLKVPPKSSPQKEMGLVDFITSSAMCPFNANQPMFKTNLLKRMGGFDEQLKQAEDWEYWMRILRHGYYFIPTNIRDITYRARSGSMVRRNPMEHLDVSRRHFEASHSYLPKVKTYDDVPFVFHKPWIEYKKQLDIANRVLEFCGMEMGRSEDSEAMYSLAKKMLPDFRGAISPHRDIAGRIMIGIKRQKNSKTVSEDLVRYYLREQVPSFLENISTSTENSVSGSCEPEPEPNYPGNHGYDPGLYKNIDIIFLPHKDYHVWSFSLLLPELDRKNISYMFVDMSSIYRDEGATRELKKKNLPNVGYNTFVLGNFRPKVIVCMNDWDPIVRNVIVLAKKAGISTVGIVEGVQDYMDADTGRSRQTYRTVKNVVLPGQFDAKYFDDSDNNIWIGGIPRVDELKKENPEFPEKPLAVINSNFTYNVLTECRDNWVKTAVESCKKAGIEYVISRHPADVGDFSAYNVSSKSMYDLLRECSVFISRFGSGIIESLAMGKPAIYYNSHGEQIDKFKEPMGAYPICNSPSALVEGIEDTLRNPDKYLVNAPSFIEHHAGVSQSGELSATKKTARILVEILGSGQYSEAGKRGLLRELLHMQDYYHATPVLDLELYQRRVAGGIGKEEGSNVVPIISGVKNIDRLKKYITSGGRRGNGSVGAGVSKASSDRISRKWRKFVRTPYQYFDDSKPPYRHLRKFFRETA